MSILGLGETSDCTNPVLDVYISKAGVPADPISLEYQIFDVSTAIKESAPVQVYPAIGRAAVDLADCPAGDRLAVGHFVANWVVPTGALTGKYELRWFYQRDATAPEQSHSQDFVVGTGSSSAVTPITLVVMDNGVVPAPVDEVRINIYDAAENFVAGGLTGVGGSPSGELTLNVPGAPDPGAQYTVRLFKVGHTFENGPTQLIFVQDPLVLPNTNIFEFVAILPVLQQSLDPDCCCLQGTFVDAAKRPIEGLILEFIPKPFFPDVRGGIVAGFTGDPTVITTRAIGRSAKVKTNKKGFVKINLPRCGAFELHMHSLENPLTITEFIQVPDEPAWELHKVIWPWIELVVYTPDTVTVPTAENTLVEVVATLSNTQIVTDRQTMTDLLEFTPGDSDIASVFITEVDDKMSLRVSGTSPGATTIEVARKENTALPSRPGLPPISVTPLVVTVI